MNVIRVIYFYVFTVIISYSVFSQQKDSVSVFKTLTNAVSDIQKAKALTDVSEYYLHKDLTKSLKYSQEAIRLSVKNKYPDGIAKAECAAGEVNFLLGNFDESKSNYVEALAKSKELKDQIGIAEAYSGLGKIAYKIGESDAALNYFSNSLELFEAEHYKNALPGLYINLGLLYDDAKNYSEAINFYNKALAIGKEINDEIAIGSSYTNLGGIYILQKKYDLGIECLNRSLIIKEKLGNKKGVGVTLNNLGAAFYEMHNLEKALSYFEKAYAIYFEINDPKSIFSSCNNIGTINLERGNNTVALEYFNRAYAIALKSQSVNKRIICLENLTLVHKALGNARQALDYSIKCNGLKDTLYDKDQAEITAELQTKFASEKKQKENEILNLQVKSESFIKTIFIIAAFLLLVIAFYIYRGLRQKQKINAALNEKNKIIEDQKLTVEHQKHIVEEQNKDITDSIRYAERIQNAILPPEKMWNTLLPQSFVFYKPKDILSGDFYWIEQKGDLIFVAAADCTGHGVPGALISIVNYNLLNKAVLEKDLNDPADILNYVNNQLIISLHQTYQESSVKDGMDISLCVINTKTFELQFAGANNPIYIVNEKELIQIDADKFPVGAFIEDKIQLFSSKKIQLQKDNSIYLFSDGFADQFGGPKGKKYKYKQFKDVLVNIQSISMYEQQQYLSNEFNTWQGLLEQVDDVLVIGIKL